MGRREAGNGARRLRPRAAKAASSPRSPDITSNRCSRPTARRSSTAPAATVTCGRRNGRTTRASSGFRRGGGEPVARRRSADLRRSSAPRTIASISSRSAATDEDERSPVQRRPRRQRRAQASQGRLFHRDRLVAGRAVGGVHREVERLRDAVRPDRHQPIDDRPGLRSRCPCASACRATRGENLHWSGDSQQLHWSLGPELFERDAEGRLRLRAPARPDAARQPRRSTASTSASTFRPTSRAGKLAFIGRARSSRCAATRSSTTAPSSSRATASPPSAGASEVAVPAGAKVVDCSGKTIMPGLVDVHWHGAMATDGRSQPQQNWVLYAVAGVRRDDAARSVQRHAAGLRRRARCSAPGSIVAPRIFSTGTILYGAKGDFQRRDRQPRRRALPPAAHEGGRRVQRQELQPAAARPAPAGHRGGARARDDGRARGRLAASSTT